MLRRLTEFASGLKEASEVVENVAIVYEGVLVRLLLGSPPEEAISRARKLAEMVVVAQS